VLPNGTPAATPQSLVNVLLSGTSGITVVPGSEQYTGAQSASGVFINGGTDPATSTGINYGVVLTTSDARFVSGSATSSADFANKTSVFGSGTGNALTRNAAPGSGLFSS
jgi:hypothetical protein